MNIRHIAVACIVLFYTGMGSITLANQCTPIKIESAAEIKSEELQFFVLDGEIIKPIGDPKNTSSLVYPFLLEDCGLPKHYIRREPPKLFLVKKAKFKCVVIAVGPTTGASDEATAGSPGSGASNDKC